MVLNLYTWIIIVRALLSWVNPDPYNPIVRFLYNVTEPVLGWVRRHVPVVFGGLDLSPLLVLLVIYFLRLLVTSWTGLCYYTWRRVSVNRLSDRINCHRMSATH